MTREYEVEVVRGLEEFVEREVLTTLGRPARLLGRPAEGRVAFEFGEALSRCDGLRLVNAVHLVDRFDVPRPRALLGHEHITRLMSSLRGLIDLGPKGAFRTLRVTAAGVDSAAFARLRVNLPESSAWNRRKSGPICWCPSGVRLTALTAGKY